MKLYGSLHAGASSSLGPSRHLPFSSNQTSEAQIQQDTAAIRTRYLGQRKHIDLALFRIVGTFPAMRDLPRDRI